MSRISSAAQLRRVEQRRAAGRTARRTPSWRRGSAATRSSPPASRSTSSRSAVAATGRPARPCSMRLLHRRAAPAAGRCTARTRRSRRRRARSIMRTLALLLPRRPRSSSICSASWRRRSPRRRATGPRSRCDGVDHRRAPAPRGAAAAAAPPARARAPAGGCRCRPRRRLADARGQRLARRQREHALARHVRACARWPAHCCSICASTSLGVGQRVDQRVDLVQHHEARQRVRCRGGRARSPGRTW